MFKVFDYFIIRNFGQFLGRDIGWDIGRDMIRPDIKILAGHVPCTTLDGGIMSIFEKVFLEKKTSVKNEYQLFNKT